MAATPRQARVRFWAETVLAALSGALGLLTIVWRDWLEGLGWNPDRGNGLAEWLIAGGLMAVALASALGARSHHQQRAPRGAVG